MADDFVELRELNVTLDHLQDAQRQDPESTEHRDAIRAVSKRIEKVVERRGRSEVARKSGRARRKSTGRKR